MFVVTGSAGGIGGAIRTRIEAEGHEVIGVDVLDAEVRADLASSDGRQAAIDEIGRVAGHALDGLVVAAGIGGSTGAPSSLVARVNYFGAVTLLDGLRPLLERGDRPAAVAIASNSATAVPLEDSTLVDLLLAGDEAGAADVADRLGGSSSTRTRSSRWHGRSGIGSRRGATPATASDSSGRARFARRSRTRLALRGRGTRPLVGRSQLLLTSWR